MTLQATDRALANVDALLAGRRFHVLATEDNAPEIPDDLAALDAEIAYEETRRESKEPELVCKPFRAVV